MGVEGRVREMETWTYAYSFDGEELCSFEELDGGLATRGVAKLV
jgi:hypothetical protein